MLDTSKVYTSNNYGKFKITKYNSHDNVEVEFIDTGYKTTSEAGQIIDGRVKDKLKPNVCGVGFVGQGKYKPYSEGADTKQYTAWISMIRRCYSKIELDRFPTYKNCTVCKEWLNFQNFAKWFDDNYIDGFELDKDIKFDGNKIYSPNNCSFVSQKDNAIKAHSKTFSFISPEGHLVKLYNLAEFCRKLGLTSTHMSKVNLGKRNTHKGWSRAK